MTKTLVIGITISQLTFIVKTPRAHAGILSLVTNLMADEASSSVVSTEANSQKMPLLEAPINSNGTASLAVADETSSKLQADQTASIPTDTSTDVDSSPVLSAPTNSVASNKITTYKVQAGDTISSIALKFNISVNTVLWSNNLTKNSTLKSNQSLVILPISGIEYTVGKGDTLSTIADKYNGDIDEIMAFNNIGKGDPIKPGQTLLIPDGEQTTSSAPVAKTQTTSVAAKVSTTAKKVATAALGISTAKADTSSDSTSGANANSTSYYIRPINGGTRTQGIHGNNAVDLAEACGTPIYASAAGEVIVSKDNGAWNGGYGNYVVITHGNGSQTLYGHMQTITVDVGESVTQGEKIGTIGNTGEVSGATGCHVHFEIRGGIVNPF